MAIIAAVIPSICMGYSAKYNRLVSEKQRKMAELEECSGNVNGWKIAGISTLGLTAVGVAGNVALANKSKDYDKQIEKTEKSIESYDQKITAQKQEKMRQAEEEANKNACTTSDGKWESGRCTCQQGKTLNGNRCGEPAANTAVPAAAATPAVSVGTDCTADAKKKDANVASATIDESGKCVVKRCTGGLYPFGDKCQKIEKISALNDPLPPEKIEAPKIKEQDKPGSKITYSVKDNEFDLGISGYAQCNTNAQCNCIVEIATSNMGGAAKNGIKDFYRMPECNALCLDFCNEYAKQEIANRKKDIQKSERKEQRKEARKERFENFKGKVSDIFHKDNKAKTPEDPAKTMEGINQIQEEIRGQDYFL